MGTERYGWATRTRATARLSSRTGYEGSPSRSSHSGNMSGHSGPVIHASRGGSSGQRQRGHHVADDRAPTPTEGRDAQHQPQRVDASDEVGHREGTADPA